MDGIDKGLVELRGRPMISHVLERFAPQVDEVLLSANRNLERYAAFGHQVIEDTVGGYAGPLAGFERGLALAHHELVATVPCDTPFLPLDLVARLSAALHANAAQLAVAKTTRAQPVFCLLPRSLQAQLRAYLDCGARKVDAWYATLNVVEVAFDDAAGAFENINTSQELRRQQT